jgi:ABC-type transport system involved in multi-copper enzyme maturation permease subunit
MMRVTWIQHKTAFISVAMLSFAIAIVLLITGQGEHAAFSSYLHAGCNTVHPLDITKCLAAENTFNGDDYALTVVLMAISVFPILIGMFLGAPLLSREFESGTFRFGWTQGVGRVRLLTSKLVLLSAGTIIATVGLGLLVAWWCAPFNGIGFTSRWQAGQFDITAITLPAWTVFSLVLGVCVGSLSRRALPAMAISAAAMAGLILSVFVWLDSLLLEFGTRVYQITANQTPNPLLGALHRFAFGNEVGPKGSWLVSGWLTNASGQRLSTAESHAVFLHAANLEERSPIKNAVMVWLTQHHYLNWVSYQPAGRYWVFQAIEGGGLLLLTLLLGVVTVWVVRRMTPSYFVKFQSYISRVFHRRSASSTAATKVGMSSSE